MAARPAPTPAPGPTGGPLTTRQRQVLEFIDSEVRQRGYPPSVREIGEAVGLSSPSTVHAHLAALQDKGYLRRDPSKPRAIEVTLEPSTGADIDRRPVRHVPLLGDVAAGTGVLAVEQVEELMPVPEDLTGDGELFMLRVRGESMIDAGIYDGDFVVVRVQPSADPGDVVVARYSRRRGDGQDLPAQAQQDRAPAGQRDDGRPRLRPERRQDLRQGRHTPPPHLTRRALAHPPSRRDEREIEVRDDARPGAADLRDRVDGR